VTANQELALTLFQHERLTLGQAAQLCALPQLDFQRLLASRRIPVHYAREEMSRISAVLSHPQPGSALKRLEIC
jgi:predicted HTH domain antitoxin